MTNIHNKSIITETNQKMVRPELILTQNRLFDTTDMPQKIKSISNVTVERNVPGTLVVNIIQNPQEERMQTMLQPSATVRTPKINTTRGPKFPELGFLPERLNQEPTSPTHRLCVASNRRGPSPLGRHTESPNLFPKVLKPSSPELRMAKPQTAVPQVRNSAISLNMTSKPSSSKEKKLSVTLTQMTHVSPTHVKTTEDYRVNKSQSKKNRFDDRYCC